MTESDIRTGKEMLQEDFIQANPKWVEELGAALTRGRVQGAVGCRVHRGSRRHLPNPLRLRLRT